MITKTLEEVKTALAAECSCTVAPCLHQQILDAIAAHWEPRMYALASVASEKHADNPELALVIYTAMSRCARALRYNEIGSDARKFLNA